MMQRNHALRIKIFISAPSVMWSVQIQPNLVNTWKLTQELRLLDVRFADIKAIHCGKCLDSNNKLCIKKCIISFFYSVIPVECVLTYECILIRKLMISTKKITYRAPSMTKIPKRKHQHYQDLHCQIKLHHPTIQQL